MNSTTVAADGGATSTGTPIIDLHPDIIQSHILNRLDGPTLASAACSSSQLLSLCSDDRLWTEICNSTFPSTADSSVRAAIASFPSGHRSFYSDSFPTVRRSLNLDLDLQNRQSRKFKSDRPIAAATSSELISAVDIYCGENLLLSKVILTQTQSSWFAHSPFRLDLLQSSDDAAAVATPLKVDREDDSACVGIAREQLRVSWIVIDPCTKRAINVATSSAVDARRHWLTEGIQLRFATVVEGLNGEAVQLAVVMTCGGKDGGELQVREVSMQVEDMEGRTLTGKDSLVILHRAMEGQRCKFNSAMEKDIYERFLRRKEELSERKRRRESLLDTCFMSIGLWVFVFMLWVFFWRT